LKVGEWKEEKNIFHLQLKMRTVHSNGVIRSWTENKYFQASPPHLLVGYKRVDREQGIKSSRTIYEGVKNGDQFDVTTTKGKGRNASVSKEKVAASRETLRDYLTVQILISTGKLSERDERTIYEYQVNEGKDHTIDLKIQRLAPQFMQGVDATLWRVWARHREGAANEVPFYAYFDQKGQLVSYGDPYAGVGGRRVSEDWIRVDRMNPSLYFSRIPVSGSRAVPGQIRRLLLQIMNTDILVPSEDAPGLKVHRISPFNTLVELSALDWESGEEGEQPTQGEWLEPESEVQSDHPDIRKAVEEALSTVEMDRRTDNLRALLKWLNKNALPSYRPEITDALGALKSGAAGGPGRTALFTAMARASGIPARRVTGLVHRDGYLSYNEWAEVWHGGWRPVDPGRGALHLSGEYMRLAVIGEQFDLYRNLDVPQALKVQLATLGGASQDVLLMEDGGVLFGQNEASGDGLLFRTETMEILFPLNYGEMRDLSPDGIFKAMNRVVELGRYGIYFNHQIGISFERPSGDWVMQAKEKSGGRPANQGLLLQLS
ncbi:MAG: transglutaminase-like domain-containing protein, partial [Planctomycetota bacterium]|nr:transglutaminase-like domain-containing protein [Planctomycetota bacterium]